MPSASETSKLTAGIKVWTEQELLHLVGSGLLKSVTDTVAVIEAPNIVATDITLLVANGNVGRTSGQVTIKLDGHTFTDDENVAMAAAEHKDVSYLSGPAITGVHVNFDGPARTIEQGAGSAGPASPPARRSRCWATPPTRPTGWITTPSSR